MLPQPPIRQRHGGAMPGCAMAVVVDGSAREVLQDLADVLARRDLRVVTQNPTLLVDETRDTPRGACRAIVGGAVREGEALVGVAEEREGQRELPGEGGVVLRRVEARAEDHRVQRFEVADSITESDAFGRSAGGVGLRVEVEQDLLAAQVGEADGAAVVRGGGELGSGISGLQHAALLPEPRSHTPTGAAMPRSAPVVA